MGIGKIIRFLNVYWNLLKKFKKTKTNVEFTERWVFVYFVFTFTIPITLFDIFYIVPSSVKPPLSPCLYLLPPDCTIINCFLRFTISFGQFYFLPRQHKNWGNHRCFIGSLFVWLWIMGSPTDRKIGRTGFGRKMVNNYL